jgi:hypothetical protein
MLVPLVDLFEGAARLSGVLARGQAMNATLGNSILQIFNGMVDLMSIDGLVLWRTSNEQFSLVGNKSIYTIGPTGDWVTNRPTEIKGAYTVISGVSYPVDVIDQDTYNLIGLKGQTQDIVEKLLYVNTDVVGVVTVWPVPLNPYPIFLSTSKIVDGTYAITDSISWPPGYEMMLRYNLAVMIGIEMGLEPLPHVDSIAKSSRAAVKRSNKSPATAKFDPILSGSGVTTWQRGY